MILVDTSVWVEHLRRGNVRLAAMLETASVLVHPFVIGEIACGSMANRQTVLTLLQDLPMATVADDDEVLEYIERHRLWGKGIGYVDVHLLAATALTQGATIWTLDKRLGAAASSLKLALGARGAH